MDEYQKIVVLENEIEAQLMDSILTEHNIPHRMRSYHDSAYDGIYQAQKGWGHIEAPLVYKADILAIHADLPVKDQREEVEKDRE